MEHDTILLLQRGTTNDISMNMMTRIMDGKLENIKKDNSAVTHFYSILSLILGIELSVHNSSILFMRFSPSVEAT